MMRVLLVLGLVLLGSVPAMADTPAVPAPFNPAPIPPAAGVAWIDGRLAALAAAAQTVATPVATVALIAAGFALLVGWLFSAKFLQLIGRWLVGGVLFGYFLIMAAPRLVAAVQGFVAR